MTDNDSDNSEKRFKTNIRMVIDTTKNYGARVLSPEEIVDCLNALHEENTILKTTNEEMEDYLARLEEENQQLKEEIETLHEQLAHDIGDLK